MLHVIKLETIERSVWWMRWQSYDANNTNSTLFVCVQCFHSYKSDCKNPIYFTSSTPNQYVLWHSDYINLCSILHFLYFFLSFDQNPISFVWWSVNSSQAIIIIICNLTVEWVKTDRIFFGCWIWQAWNAIDSHELYKNNVSDAHV